MILIVIIIAAFFGLLGLMLFKRCQVRSDLASLLTVFVVIICMGLTVHYIVPYYSAATYRYFELQDPALATIAKQFPDEFNDYINQSKKSILADENSYYKQMYKIVFLDKVLIHTLARAQNDPIYQLYKTEVMADDFLYAINPELVTILEFYSRYTERPDPKIVFSILGTAMPENIILAKENVILSALQNPQPPLTDDQKKIAAAQVDDIKTGLVNQFGAGAISSLVNKPLDASSDKKQDALTLITFYKQILLRGEAGSADIFRYLLSGQQP